MKYEVVTTEDNEVLIKTESAAVTLKVMEGYGCLNARIEYAQRLAAKLSSPYLQPFE